MLTRKSRSACSRSVVEEEGIDGSSAIVRIRNRSDSSLSKSRIQTVKADRADILLQTVEKSTYTRDNMATKYPQSRGSTVRMPA